MQQKKIIQTVAIIIAIVIVGIFFYLTPMSSSQQPSNVQGTEDEVAAPEAPGSGLIIRDDVVGTGDQAIPGAMLTVNYVGTLSDGTKFDSSYDRNQPFTFTFGVGQVIPGWEQGLVGMKVGGKRTLVIPSGLAYGEKGIGPIPPNATLVFQVELLQVGK